MEDKSPENVVICEETGLRLSDLRVPSKSIKELTEQFNEESVKK